MPLLYELDWLQIGESLNSDKVLYRDFLSPIAPLAAWVYKMIALVFGKSILALQILSILLVTYQFSLFNNIMLRNKAYNENSYIPAFIYALMMSVFYDFFTLSPVLISLTFILLVLDNIYLRIENKLQDDTILKTGIFMGLAVLFYLPSIFFLFGTLVSFALLTSLMVRRYFLFLYGFIFPIAVVMIYYYWQDGLEAMMTQWVKFNLLDSVSAVIDLQSILLISIFPLIVFGFSLYKTSTGRRFTNYQIRVQQVMFVMLLAAFGSWWFSHLMAPYELVVFVPAFTFFITHFIFQFRSRGRAEIFALFFSVLLIGGNYATFYKNTKLHYFGQFDKLKATDSIYEEIITEKSLMVLGGKIDLYSNVDQIATQFYHPVLSKVILEEMNETDREIALRHDIDKHKPDVILDFLGFIDDDQKNIAFQDFSYRQLSKNLYLRSSIEQLQ